MLAKIKEEFWNEVNEEVLFISESGNKKIELINGKDFNQFESICNLYANDLAEKWNSRVFWMLVTDAVN